MLLPFVRAEDPAYQVGVPDCYVQQRAFAGCLVMSYGGFIQMSAVVARGC